MTFFLIGIMKHLYFKNLGHLTNCVEYEELHNLLVNTSTITSRAKKMSCIRYMKVMGSQLYEVGINNTV